MIRPLDTPAAAAIARFGSRQASTAKVTSWSRWRIRSRQAILCIPWSEGEQRGRSRTPAPVVLVLAHRRAPIAN